jgi:mono/diheme cytochrome c family protein
MKISKWGANGWVVCLALALAVPALIVLATISNAGQPPAGAGESIFKAKCAMCHGADGGGDTTMGKKMKVRDLGSAEVQKQSDAELAEIIAKGKPPMSGYEKQLDKEKIKQVVSYLRELCKKK